MHKIWMALLCYGFTAARAQNNLTLTAHVPGLKAGDTVYLSTLGGDQKDSVFSTRDGFVFHKHINEGEGDAYLLRIGKQYTPGSLTLLYLDKGQVVLTSKGPLFKDVRLSGAAFARDFTAFGDFEKKDAILSTADTIYKQYQDLYSKKDTAAMSAMQPALARIDSARLASSKTWIKEHPNSPISAYVLKRNLSYNLSLEEQGKILAGLSPEARNNAMAKAVAFSIKVDKLTGIGREALPFTQDDTAGKPVSLKDFRGKYVLVDFWASWCKPCRAENPNVVAAYHKYSGKGFTVLSVSLDQPNAKDRWLKAIHDDGLTWNHVSDLKYWNNAVAKQYDIRSIPSNLLIDPDGKIVAKDLREEALDKKLEALLGASFTLSGQVSGRDKGFVQLYYTDTTGKRFHDSAALNGGAFTFRGQIKEPTQAYLMLDRTNEASIFLEPSAMTIGLTVGDFKHAAITGSASQKEQEEMEQGIAPILEEMKPMDEAYEKAGETYRKAVKDKASDAVLDTMKEQMARMHDAFDPYQQRIAAANYAFFASHPQSYVTAFNLRFYASRMPLDSIEMFYNNLGPTVGASASGKEIAKTIRKIKAGSPGSVAADFTTADIQGKPLHFADFKGKYVILDFWASWCVPCRHGNPHLREVYQRYHGAGLDIISVSDDDNNHAAWMKAVEKDSIGIWHHVLRGLDWSKLDKGIDNPNDISELFGISSLPTKILIDPQGKIVGRFDEQAGPLDAKLAEIFK